MIGFIPVASGGGGGAPSGPAGGELADTYPNPTVKDAVIDDANIVAGGLTNAAIAAAAAIAKTKISGTAITAGDTGTVTNAMLAGSIANGKLATDPLARANHTGTQLMATISDAGSLATKSAVASADITDGTIVNGDINASAAIVLTKLATITNGNVVAGINGANTTRPLRGNRVPTGALAETYDRSTASLSTTLTSGTVYLSAIELDAGQVISNLNVRLTGTTQVGGTHFWQGIADSSRLLVAVSADDTTAVHSTNTTVTQAVANIVGGASSTYTVPSSGMYYHVLCMVGTGTMPTILTGPAHTQAAEIAPKTHGTSNTAQTTPIAANTTLTAITGVANSWVYAWLT